MLQDNQTELPLVISSYLYLSQAYHVDCVQVLAHLPFIRQLTTHLSNPAVSRREPSPIWHHRPKREPRTPSPAIFSLSLPSKAYAFPATPISLYGHLGLGFLDKDSMPRCTLQGKRAKCDPSTYLGPSAGVAVDPITILCHASR
jgi:hypothetical protein